MNSIESMSGRLSIQHIVDTNTRLVSTQWVDRKFYG